MTRWPLLLVLPILTALGPTPAAAQGQVPTITIALSRDPSTMDPQAHGEGFTYPSGEPITHRAPLAPLLTRPARNIVPNLVYAETGSNVRLTMVAGKVIYRDGEYTNVDRQAVFAAATAAAGRLQDAVAADPVTANLPIVELTREGRI
jgi:ABC-type transport system substrate-binding protein